MKADEARGKCQRCGEEIVFQSWMVGQDLNCPRCGKQTTLVPQPGAKAEEKAEPRSFLTDPNWDNRIENPALRTVAKGAHATYSLIYGIIALLVFGGIGIFLFIEFMRFLHFAWGN